MHCRVCYLLDFDLKISSGQVCHTYVTAKSLLHLKTVILEEWRQLKPVNFDTVLFNSFYESLDTKAVGVTQILGMYSQEFISVKDVTTKGLHTIYNLLYKTPSLGIKNFAKKVLVRWFSNQLMCVFCDRLTLCSTAALYCRTCQNEGRYHKKELSSLLVLLIS